MTLVLKVVNKVSGSEFRQGFGNGLAVDRDSGSSGDMPWERMEAVDRNKQWRRSQRHSECTAISAGRGSQQRLRRGGQSIQ
jgi:hypothetical protein